MQKKKVEEQKKEDKGETEEEEEQEKGDKEIELEQIEKRGSEINLIRETSTRT